MASDTQQTFELPFFDVTLLHQPSLVMIVGNPGSGKTYTAKSLLLELAYDAWLNKRRDFPLLHMAMYGSKGDGEYGRSIHPTTIFDDVQGDALKNIVNRSLRIRRDAISDPEQTDREDMTTRVILDDVTSSRQIFENKSARFIWRKNRHINLSMWLCSQYVNDAPSWMRQLFSVVFIRSVNNSDRRELFKNYGQLFKDHHTFSQILTETTKTPGRSLVLYLRSPTDHPTAKKNAQAAVAYYDSLPKERCDMLMNTLNLVHPDIHEDLEKRGDPQRYDEMEQIV